MSDEQHVELIDLFFPVTFPLSTSVEDTIYMEHLLLNAFLRAIPMQMYILISLQYHEMF